MKPTYKHTLRACYLGCIAQAVVNNLPALLFLTFHTTFGISLNKIALLIALNFCVQIATDYLAIFFVDKIGHRVCAVAAHLLCGTGLISLAILPFIMPPFVGLCVCVIIMAIGGGLIEVLISPIVESLPGDEKASAMSLLHSFYCWGHVGVILLSTLFFVVIGTKYWPILALLWALLPLLNALLFSKVPLLPPLPDGERMPLGKLFTKRVFWLFFLLMVCAGASEQAMSQWASLFAEAGLGVSKAVGDLLGPCSFAALMGLARLLYGLFANKVRTQVALFASSLLCIASYALTVFAPHPLLSLLGCALCGFSVGIMWPGVFSLAAARYRAGGTSMFAILALAGDLGCAAGPALVGLVSSAAQATSSGIALGLKMGLACAAIFPLLLALSVFMLRRQKQIVSIKDG